nr:hypothetical protein [Tanacetum cinerariifolium]
MKVDIWEAMMEMEIPTTNNQMISFKSFDQNNKETHVFWIPISFGRYHKREVLCASIDMEDCHIRLERS